LKPWPWLIASRGTNSLLSWIIGPSFSASASRSLTAVTMSSELALVTSRPAISRSGNSKVSGVEVLGLDVDARIVDPDQHDAGVRDLLLLVADRDVDLVLVRLRVNADRCVHLHAVDQPPAAQQEPVEQPGHDRAQQRDPGDDGVEADGGQVDGHGGRACHVSKPTDRRGHDTPGDDAAFQELPCRPREFLTEVLFGY